MIDPVTDGLDEEDLEEGESEPMPVIDEVVRVDHAAILEPLPLVLRNLEILAVTGNAVC